MKNLIFDYDGTLHDCIRIYAPAFRQVCRLLAAQGYMEQREWSETEISRWLGYSSREMWDAFAPDLPEEQKKRCSEQIGAEMLRQIQAGNARLYPHVPEILERLKKQGYCLIFLSNCRKAYMEAHRRQFGLERYFSEFYCTEDYDWKPKTEIFPEICRQFAGEFLVIGDRKHDREVARQFHLPFIGCSYGYGKKEELAGADFLAQSPEDILGFLEKSYSA